MYSIHSDVFNSKPYRQFNKYVLMPMDLSSRESKRLFHSWSQSTVESYTKVIEKYVLYSKEERKSAFPATERSVRAFIDSLNILEDRTKLNLLKPSFVFAQKCRDDPLISFNSSDLILEGIFREIGNNFPKKLNICEVKELDIRKFLLRALYGPRMRKPYNPKLSEFRTGLRCLTSLYCLSRCADYMLLKKEDLIFEDSSVVIVWRKRKNNQRASRQTSLVPELENHPLDLVSAFRHWISVVKLKDGQSLNAKLTKSGAVNGTDSISRSTCYQDNKKICSSLKLSPISEKLCKSLGTR